MKKIYEKATNSMHGFTKTNEKVEITYAGWDGKSYDGEVKKTNVWVCDTHPGKKFVYCRKSFQNFDGSYKADCFHIITDEMHKVTNVPVVDYFTSYDVNYTVA